VSHMPSPFPAGAPIRVLIADDHGLVRAGLRAILSSEPDMAVVGEAADGAQALELAIRLRPTVVLADISMPPPDGIEVARRLALQAPESRTLIVSMHEDPNMLLDALSAGASGYLIKRAMEHDLTLAIRTVANGQQYIHETLRSYLAQATPGPAPAEPSTEESAELDERETGLLRLLAMGNTLQRVADALDISLVEADELRKATMARLGLRSRIDVVRYVQQHLGG
jgi:DNA-binding NarL/FixJ family response regulator